MRFGGEEHQKDSERGVRRSVQGNGWGKWNINAKQVVEVVEQKPATTINEARHVALIQS